jgi:phosphoserine phosphatase RsbU/P
VSGTTITVSGPEGTQRMPADPDGMIVGRSRSVDLVLESSQVSRRHARIHRDPFGRWIVEDLGSRNGVVISGKKHDARAVLPGEKIMIGPFQLEVARQSDPLLPEHASAHSTTTHFHDAPIEDMVGLSGEGRSTLSRDDLARLNEFTDRLAEVTDPGELYPEVCRFLATDGDTAAAVLRTAKPPRPLQDSVKVLACHLGGPQEVDTGHVAAALQFSTRVLETVRNTGNPVLASSNADPMSATQMALTIVDEHEPRAVCSAPVCSTGETLDVLYMDSPIRKTGAGAIDFVLAVARQVDFARKSLLLSQARAERLRLDDQLSLACKIQEKLVPQSIDCPQGIDIALSYRPAMWVGGDYCDAWSAPDGRLVFAVGDVSGKGLPAAMAMTNLQALLRSAVSFCGSAADVMNHVNGLLLQNLPDDMFVTMFLGFVHPGKGELEYVNAGHLQPVLIPPGVSATLLGEPRHPPLGTGAIDFISDVQRLSPGTALVGVTDGVTDTNGPDGTLFGADRLLKSLGSSEFGSSDDLIRIVNEALAEFRQDRPQQDDITILALLNHGV